MRVCVCMCVSSRVVFASRLKKERAYFLCPTPTPCSIYNQGPNWGVRAGARGCAPARQRTMLLLLAAAVMVVVLLTALSRTRANYLSYLTPIYVIRLVHSFRGRASSFVR